MTYDIIFTTAIHNTHLVRDYQKPTLCGLQRNPTLSFAHVVHWEPMLDKYYWCQECVDKITPLELLAGTEL